MADLSIDILSEREGEILELAIEGLTDQQIGSRLNITASTVNSYWVRIRGKLGHLSRTELVSRVVKEQSNGRILNLTKRIAALEEELRGRRQTEDSSADTSLFYAALEANPEACIVMSVDFKALWSNLRFRTMFGTTERIVDRPFNELFRWPATTELPLELSTLADRETIGLKYPLYGLKSDRTTFRVLCFVGVGDLLGERILSFVVRPFSSEIELLRDSVSLLLTDVAEVIRRYEEIRSTTAP